MAKPKKEDTLVKQVNNKPERNADGTLKKGSTANMEGRPKKGFAVTDAVRKVMNTPIEVTETYLDKKGNKRKRKVTMSNREAIMKRAALQAVTGDKDARKFLAGYDQGKPIAMTVDLELDEVTEIYWDEKPKEDDG